jgi:hypothetical protein
MKPRGTGSRPPGRAASGGPPGGPRGGQGAGGGKAGAPTGDKRGPKAGRRAGAPSAPGRREPRPTPARGGADRPDRGPVGTRKSAPAGGPGRGRVRPADGDRGRQTEARPGAAKKPQGEGSGRPPQPPGEVSYQRHEGPLRQPGEGSYRRAGGQSEPPRRGVGERAERRPWAPDNRTPSRRASRVSGRIAALAGRAYGPGRQVGGLLAVRISGRRGRRGSQVQVRIGDRASRVNGLIAVPAGRVRGPGRQVSDRLAVRSSGRKGRRGSQVEVRIGGRASRVSVHVETPASGVRGGTGHRESGRIGGEGSGLRDRPIGRCDEPGRRHRLRRSCWLVSTRPKW